ncbi:MAG: GDSL-type esterase/lipase family protein [Polyangia bacterium]
MFQWCLTATAVLAASGYARAATVVTCVGDSITAGYNLPTNQAYPVQLGMMLGSAYTVKNFGVSSTTLLKNGNYSYWSTSNYGSSLGSNPNFVIIQFGTNDSKPANWNSHGPEFVGDYKSMIAAYRAVSTHPMVIPCLIPPYYLPNPWPTDFPDPARIPNLLQPAIRQVISDTSSPSIDNYAPLVNKPQLSGDGIHPTVDGAHILARNAYNAVTGAKLAVLTGTNINDGGGSWGGGSSNTASAGFDVNSRTYYDAARGTGAWTGVNLGSANNRRVKMICYAPRVGYEGRMVGGVFQGSNDLSHWTNLATISTTPAATYAAIPVNGAAVYRYLRYYAAAAGSYGNVAEVEFLGN